MARVNNWLVLRDLVRAGAGVTVLPCFLGDGDPLLARLTAILPDISAEQFLLVHRDLRALPRVRAIMDALVHLFQQQRAVLEGATVTTAASTPQMRATGRKRNRAAAT